MLLVDVVGFEPTIYLLKGQVLLTLLRHTSVIGRHTMSRTWAMALSEPCATTTLYAFYYWSIYRDLNPNTMIKGHVHYLIML
jgi:hypothetical protein